MTAARLWLVGCCAAVTLTTGCASTTQVHGPADVPSAFENSATNQDSNVTNQASVSPTLNWYRAFSSQQLDQFVEWAQQNNLDLVEARARVTQADARARQAGAAILPSVDAGGNANFLAGHSQRGTAHETDWSALLSASYELDLWGKNRAQASAATYLATGSRAERDALTLTVLAGVADGYFQVLALRERLTIARSNADLASKMLEVVQARYDAGMAAPVELATQKAAAAAAALAIPELQQQEQQARAALALLVGRVPEGFQVDNAPLDALSEPIVSAGLPAQLLTRRPDLMAAEANLQAAHADVAVARAALLPSVSLTAGAGLQYPAMNAALNSLAGAGPTLNLGASVTRSIFDRGRLRAVRAEAQAKEEELIATYRAAIIAALIDVENALAAIHHLDGARPMQMENLMQTERAFEGASQRYQAGSGDYLTLLEAQRSLYAARDQFVLYKLGRLQALVSLCKALGGGWTQSSEGR
jgi:multidrug efflux system outer membrane protein